LKDTNSKERLKEVALLFLRLGATAFGGAAAYIAIMQQETVRKRGWLDDQKFLDMLGISNLIPGPTATEMALYIGLEQAGWLGYLSAGLLFIVPGMLITIAIAWAYVRYASLPVVHMNIALNPTCSTQAAVLQSNACGATRIPGSFSISRSIVDFFNFYLPVPNL